MRARAARERRRGQRRGRSGRKVAAVEPRLEAKALDSTPRGAELGDGVGERHRWRQQQQVSAYDEHAKAPASARERKEISSRFPRERDCDRHGFFSFGASPSLTVLRLPTSISGHYSFGLHQLERKKETNVKLFWPRQDVCKGWLRALPASKAPASQTRGTIDKSGIPPHEQIAKSEYVARGGDLARASLQLVPRGPRHP